MCWLLSWKKNDSETLRPLSAAHRTQHGSHQQAQQREQIERWQLAQRQTECWGKARTDIIDGHFAEVGFDPPELERQRARVHQEAERRVEFAAEHTRQPTSTRQEVS